MLEQLAAHLDFFAALAPVWGYAFIFLFMAVESSFIPFPSEIVMLPAGFLAARGELTLRLPAADLTLAVVAGLLGSLVGAYFNYFLSRFLGEPFLRKYGKWFFVKPAALDRAEEIFNRYGGVTTFLCRLVPVIRQIISIPAGLSGMPLGKFTLFTGLGAGIWTAVLAATGYALGLSAGDITYLELVEKGKALVDRHLVWLILGGAVLAAGYLLVSKRVMRRTRVCLALVLLPACWPIVSAAADFQHTLKGAVKPWTHERFLDDPQEFHFAIVPDRTGSERPGYFGKAMKALNLLRPEFVMSVGDLVAGGGVSKPALEKQWAELHAFVESLEMPFFYVVGNHDIWTGIRGMTPARQTSIDLWKAYHGTNTYYSFTYKNCLFLCFDTMEKHDYFPPHEALSENQMSWALGELEKYRNVRWTFMFMHKPIDWTSDRWLAFERKITARDYTVFCGDWHNFCTATRHGKKYYMIGTVGGGWDGGVTEKDLRYGIMDAITWVTVTKKGPVVSYVEIGGVHADTVQTSATSLGWIETPLDYPSHLAENPLKYADEKNTALIPTEVTEGPGYDWHFRHAIILRKGRCLPVGYERFKRGTTKRVILLGDESASALASGYGKEWETFDFGFKGDRIENVLWRVMQGELSGYAPDRIVISAGAHNRGRNTEEEIAAAKAKLVASVRARVSAATEIVVVP